MASKQSLTVIALFAVLLLLPVLSYFVIVLPVPWTGIWGLWIGVGILAVTVLAAAVWLGVHDARKRASRER